MGPTTACKCGKLEIVKHFLMECNLYVQYMLENNCLQSLMVCLKRESASIPKLTWLTFYFLEKNHTYLKNINIISISSQQSNHTCVKLKGQSLMRVTSQIIKQTIIIIIIIRTIKMTQLIPHKMTELFIYFFLYWNTLCMLCPERVYRI